MESGHIRRYVDTRGFGFVSRNSGERDLFFHVSDSPRLPESSIRQGAPVLFEVVNGSRGEVAVDVTLDPSAAPPVRERGVVTRFDVARGFGFIQREDAQPCIFVHLSDLAHSEQRDLLQPGAEVEFECLDGERGPRAVNVDLIGGAA